MVAKLTLHPAMRHATQPNGSEGRTREASARIGGPLRQGDAESQDPYKGPGGLAILIQD